MIGTYEEYLREPKSLTVEEMQALHRAMLEELGDDEDAWDLYRDLVQAAVDYAAVRAQWQLYSYAERSEKDPGRTAFHDSVILNFNMLGRYLSGTGHAAEWRETLGYEEDDPMNRKRIGDFACWIAFVAGINAR